MSVSRRSIALALLLSLPLAGVGSRARAADIGGLQLDDTVRVAGRDLRLNGAGIGQQWTFKVYAIGLYVSTPVDNAAAVMGSADARRVVIRLLRDVSGADFSRSVARQLDTEDEGDESLSATARSAMRRLCERIVALPEGLRKGDLLTLDWVPDIGTVVELNRRALGVPERDPGLYRSLLKVWLGDKPTSTTLKARLLGRAPQLHALAD